MRIVVVGAGSIGRRHIENLTSLGVDAVCVPYRAYTPNVLDHCDGVVIATATNVRFELIAHAAERDLPMYIEKPLAFRIDDLNKILCTIEHVAHRSVLGFMMRYHPALRVLADFDLSDAFHFSFDIGHDVTQWRDNWTFSDSYASKAEGGGVLLDLCHEIDMASILFPKLTVKSVSAIGHSNYPGVDFASIVAVRTESGVEGFIEMDYLTPQLHRQILIRGANGIYDFNFAAQRYEVKSNRGARLLDLPLQRNEMFMAIIKDWLALLEGFETENPLLPCLDRIGLSPFLIAAAWEARQFTGCIAKEIR
jgi:predicted dehydrogenase